jgi:hypothetical protein
MHRALIALLLLTAVASPVAAQDTTPATTPVITHPRASLPSNARAKHAYTGLPYTTLFTNIDGCYPFTYSLANAPVGMSVAGWTRLGATGNATGAYGVITWTNPTSTATNVDFIVTDNCNQTDTETMTITVGTSGWNFVDAVNGTTNGGGGTGSAANPWRTLEDVLENGAAGSRTYFRAGDYDLSGIATTGPCTNNIQPETRIAVNEASRTGIWIAYPGDARPVVDMGWTAGVVWTTCPSPPFFALTGDGLYFSGMRFENVLTKAFRVEPAGGCQGAYFWDNVFADGGPGVAGANSAFIMTESGCDKTDGAIVGNDFSGHHGTGDLALESTKTYNETRFLKASNRVHDNVDFGTDGTIAVKGGHGIVELRDNECYDFTGSCIGGNAALFTRYTVRYNLALTGGTAATGVAAEAFSVADDGSAVCGTLDVFRNTFRGRVRINSNPGCVGPFTFTANVLVNGDSAPPQAVEGFCDGEPAGGEWGNCDGVDVVDFDSINTLWGDGDDGVIDANGLLQGSFRTTFLGTRGHELAASAPTVGTPYRRRFRGLAFGQSPDRPVWVSVDAAPDANQDQTADRH